METEKKSVKILIIEDNDQDQKFMRRYFSGAGYQDILLASTAEQGIHLAEQFHPDIVVIDTRLPGMDGFEACRKIKHLPKTHIKVVMMTGFIDAVDAGRARDVGADEYCAKTADCAHLLDAIRRILS